MKRYTLKGLNTCGYYVSCGLAGFAFGKLLMHLFKGILTEEVKETKPVLFWTVYVLYDVLLTIFGFVWVFIVPTTKLWSFLNKKIDEVADDKGWD